MFLNLPALRDSTNGNGNGMCKLASSHCEFMTSTQLHRYREGKLAPEGNLAPSAAGQASGSAMSRRLRSSGATSRLPRARRRRQAPVWRFGVRLRRFQRTIIGPIEGAAARGRLTLAHALYPSASLPARSALPAGRQQWSCSTVVHARAHHDLRAQMARALGI